MRYLCTNNCTNTPLTPIFDEIPIYESASLDESAILETIDKMIADKNNPLIRIDTTDDFHFILDNVSVNHFQSLLNNAKSKKVTRIE